MKLLKANLYEIDRRRQSPCTAFPRLGLACFCVQQSRWVRVSLSGQVHTFALVLNFVFVAQKFVINGCRKQAISHQDPAWVIHITLQYRNNIIGSTKVTLSQPSAK